MFARVFCIIQSNAVLPKIMFLGTFLGTFLMYPFFHVPIFRAESTHMAKRIVPLVPKQIDNAKPKDSTYTLFDGSGLYLEIAPTGSKFWRMKAKLNGKAMRLSFGKYPDVSLAQARKKRDEARKLIAEGKDPREEKKARIEAEKARTEYTFEKIARDWFDCRLSEWRENTARKCIRGLERDVFPILGNQPISDITHQQIIDILKTVEKRAPETANRLKATLGRIYSHAIQRNIIKHNLVSDLTDVLNRYEKGHHAAIKPEEMPEFLRILDRQEMTFATRVAVNLMMLVFLRTDELIGATWSEIDLDNGVWIVPWQHMKMGKRKINPVKEDHRIDLPRQARHLLQELREKNERQEWTHDSQYLFPGQRNKERHMSNNTILKALERMGYKGKMTGHGFRTLAVSVLEEKGYRREVLDRQLAHKERNKIQAAYFRAEFIKERKELLQVWADHIDSIRTGKVIPLKRA